MYDDSVEAIWVVGTYTGDAASRIRAQAQKGIGYIIVEDSDKKGGSITVAFRKIVDGPLPPYLVKVESPLRIEEYEKIRRRRQGQDR